MSRVSIVSCRSYDISEVQFAVDRAVDLCGGIGAFIKPGQRVLLKPNLLSAKRPDEAITTHPALVEAAIHLVRRAGGSPLLGDSPGGKISDLAYYYDVTGMAEVCGRLKVEMVSFERSGVHTRTIDGRQYHIAKPALDCDVIVNLPKVKTHSLTLLTGAVKNMFGVVPGLRKSMHHRQAPKPWDFARLLVDIYSLARPALTIVDGIVGMDGMGPSAGTPRALGMVMAGDDGVSVDSVLSKTLGYPPLKIPTTRLAHELNLGVAELDRIELLGDQVSIEDFRWPANWAFGLVPGFLARAAARLFWVRPAIDADKCVNCGMCVESCPMKAIATGDQVPSFAYALCINCLCCQEICPQHAVFQRKSLIAGLLR